MRHTDSPYLADVFVLSLRWLVLFGLAISLGAMGAFATNEPGMSFPLIIAFLIVPAAWNGFMTVLAIFDRRLPWRRYINVTIDVIFSLLVFAGAGKIHWNIFWVGLLPILSTAIYFRPPAAIAIALLTSLLQIVGIFFLGAEQFPWESASMLAGFNLAAGAISILLSAPLLVRLQDTYQGTLSQRKEGERKAQRQEHERMSALFSMFETISSTLNYQKVIETIVETATAALGDTDHEAEEMVGCVLLFGRHQNLEVHAARGLAEADLAIQLPAKEGILYDTLKSGEARVLQNPGSDPELKALETLKNTQSAVCFPLIRGFHAYGVMLFAHPNPGFFTLERIETIQMLSHQAAIALQNAQLYQDLAHEKERIVKIQEDTQKKLARDLHDGPTQSISAIAMRIHIVRKLLDISQNNADPDAAQSSINDMKDELKKIEELAQHTTQEIRHMLFTLRPLVLETEGLEAALKTMAEKMAELYQQNVIVDIHPDAVELLDTTRQTVVFYLADEVVNNACKHANAKVIRVNLTLMPEEDGIAVLEIADNGVGFDVDDVMSSYDRRGSLGMVNLKERADLINGLLKIDSTPGAGTSVKIYIPLSGKAIDRLMQLK